MADANLQNLIGSVTGIIGALTGIFGAVMGYKSIRDVNRMKSLDIRIELRKLEQDIQGDLNDLPILLDRADNSRKAIFSATGRTGSGFLQQWTTEINSNRAEIQKLKEKTLEVFTEYNGMTTSELEDILIKLYAFQKSIKQIQDRYCESISDDKKTSEQIKANRSR